MLRDASPAPASVEVLAGAAGGEVGVDAGEIDLDGAARVRDRNVVAVRRARLRREVRAIRTGYANPSHTASARLSRLDVRHTASRGVETGSWRSHHETDIIVTVTGRSRMVLILDAPYRNT